VATAETAQVELWSERVHKSTTLRCTDFPATENIEFAKPCVDTIYAYQGQIDELSAHEISFVFKSDVWAASTDSVATSLGLDGILRVVPERSYWLTTSHLCSATLDADSPLQRPEDHLAFVYENLTEPATVLIADLAAAESTRDLRIVQSAATVAACTDAYEDAAAWLFPLAAGNELDWLHLSSAFLPNRAYEELQARRHVVELGEVCAEQSPDLKRAVATYTLDCGIVASSSNCRTEPSVPFRRLATQKLRIDIGADGAAALQTQNAKTLNAMPTLLAYSEGVLRALGRLAILVLVAAVVFVRGSQNAASARYTLSRTLDRLHCRGDFGATFSVKELFQSTLYERVVDFSISMLALGSRIIIVGTSAEALIDDGVGIVVAAESVGCAASLLHLGLRYTQEYNVVSDSPLTLLAGPMSILDVCAAVLVIFSDAPLLSDENSRFSSIGRLLISLLISIAVFTRCCFGTSVCAAMASSCRNGTARKDLQGFQTVLSTATACWALEGVVIAVDVAALFILPAAYAVTRSVLGDVSTFKYAAYVGLLAAGLPSTNKVLVRVLQGECDKKTQ